MRPSKVKRVKAKPKAKPETALQRRIRLLEEFVQRKLEQNEGAHNVIRDRLDKLEQLVTDMLDGTATMQVDRAVTVDQRYLSGRWIRRDGTVYAPIKENGHDQGSGKAARKRGRALRGGGQGASQSR